MSAQKTIGTTLTKTNGTPKTIADITSMSPLGVESNEIDVTTLDSPNNYSESIPGMKNGGEITISGFIKSEDNHEDMLALAEAQGEHTWRIQFPSGSKWDFRAYVKKWNEGEITVEGVRGFEGSLRVVGKPVYTASGAVSA